MIKKRFKKIAATAVAAAISFSMGCSADKSSDKSAEKTAVTAANDTDKSASANKPFNKPKGPLPDPSKPASGSRPNIILILADDLGYRNTTLFGYDMIKTPNIQSISDNGVQLMQGYVTAPICAPSRASLMTSIHPVKMGGDNNYSARKNMDRVPNNTIASILKEKGYSTMAIGKWDLGTTNELLPDRRGFEDFFGFPNGVSNYYRTGPNNVPADGWHIQNETKLVKGGTLQSRAAQDIREYDPATGKYKMVIEKEYLTDAFTREALKFIDKEAADPDPFFLYLAYNAPHGPQQAPDDHVQKYMNVSSPKTRLFNSSVDALDEQIGRVLQKLEEKGIKENTMVIFLSDNGPDAAGAPSGLNGRKHDVFEGGIRVPFAIQWPEQFEKNVKFNKAITTMDLLPTLAAAAGCDVNELKKKYNIEGVDITPYIQGKESGSTHEALYWRQVDDYTLDLEMAVRSGDFKYVSVEKKNGTKTEYLFDIANDPKEGINLALKPEHTATFEKLKTMVDKWSSQIPMADTGKGKGKNGDDEEED